MSYVKKLYKGELGILLSFGLWLIVIGIFLMQLVVGPALAFTAHFVGFEPWVGLLTKNAIQVLVVVLAAIGSWNATSKYRGPYLVAYAIRALLLLLLFSFVLLVGLGVTHNL